MNCSRLYRGGLIVGVVLAGSALTGIGVDDSVAAVKSNGVASKTPIQILNVAQSALKSAHSYVLTDEIKQSGSTMGMKLVDGGARDEMGITMGRSSVDVILASGHAYMQANASFWKTQAKSPAAAQLVAGRWIEVPESTFKGLLSDLGSLEPSKLADCLSDGPHGAITKVGTTTVGGVPAVVLKDAGNVPGDGPGTIAIATTGPAYPIQIVEGPTRAGGKVDACNDGKRDDSTGTMRLDDYDHVPVIKIPIHPIKLPESSNPVA